jgi:tetratricopeptide (TPR) repeat protein
VPTLRLKQTAEGNGQFHIGIRLEDGTSPMESNAHVKLDITPQDQENLRWYLENYLQHPMDPAPKIAAFVEKRISEIGVKLFQGIFQGNDDAREIWTLLRARLNDTRIEIITDVEQAASIPWELIRDPRTDTALALYVNAFVHSQPQAARRPQVSLTPSGPIRILLVICRPGKDEDVAFRSVASRLIKGLSESDLFQLDVLRPATFQQLGKVLRAARAANKPYHVVHFDGHGMYAEQLPEGGGVYNALLYSGLREGKHGYLAFENPSLASNVEFISGGELGDLLVEAEVPILVLNACRSAHADPPEEPQIAGDDVHTQVRIFGSLAQEVMDKGVAGVVAMRYNVYVVTAAQFVADLYAALTAGHTLGEAVTLGRKQLAADPSRTIAYSPRPLQDWCVPVVYEALPIPLFPKPSDDKGLNIKLTAGEAAPVRGMIDKGLPPQPDAGFFGRDETLLALDRAFDTQQIILMHAFAGSGKTTTAAEFARWYSLTGGVDGPVLFTSFEQYKPLARVLDDFGRVFAASLEQRGIHWLALSDADRQNIALQVMKQVEILWIWDNIEPVAGFPAGTQSAWSADEQREIADFLRAVRGTRAKFLLTSRREERGWLGDLPARVQVPPMPMQERVQLAKALAEKHGRQITDVEDWSPLLRFTRGNPLTITVLVGQALRDRLHTRAQILAFVEKLRAGEADFTDEASEGRGKSLGASLAYGFQNTFSEDERKVMALLHFFQGFVDVDALRFMGNPEADGSLPEVRGLTREVGIALLDRAAEIGLLAALGGGYYSIHPALPWYFKGLFEQYYAGDSALAATHAFVVAMGSLGNYYHKEYEDGNQDVIALLTAEEANLLHVWQLARGYGWWQRVISAMQGLHQLYDHTGRRAEWTRLVDDIVPEFVDLTTDGSLPGREEYWHFVTQYRVLSAKRERQWAEAERMQRILVDTIRQRAAETLVDAPESQDSKESNQIRNLAVSNFDLGEILRQQGNAECVTAYQESYELMLRIGDNTGAAGVARNLALTYKNLSSIRNLVEAEVWCNRSLERQNPHDELGRAKTMIILGNIARERFEDARDDNQPAEQVIAHLQVAESYYLKVLNILPPSAIDDLAITHNQLGSTYGDVNDFDHALTHYRESIRYKEAAGNIYSAGTTRYNVAVDLAAAGRLPEAREYALAALRNFETFGERAADEIQKTQKLIAAIEQDMQGGT